MPRSACTTVAARSVAVSRRRANPSAGKFEKGRRSGRRSMKSRRKRMNDRGGVGGGFGNG